MRGTSNWTSSLVKVFRGITYVDGSPLSHGLHGFVNLCEMLFIEGRVRTVVAWIGSRAKCRHRIRF